MIIYEQDGTYYMKKGDRYYVSIVYIKSHTIAIETSSEYVFELDNPVEYTYKELKKKLLGN